MEAVGSIVNQSGIANTNQNRIDNCPQSTHLFKKHKCSFCDFRSSYLWVVRRHVKSKHQRNSSSSGDQLVVAVDGGDSVQGSVQQQTEVVATVPQPLGGLRGGFDDNDMDQDDDGGSEVVGSSYIHPVQRDQDEDDRREVNGSSPSIQPVQKSGVIISSEGTVKNSIEEKEGPFDLRLIEDFKIFCQGPSRSGKSTWVSNLLKHLHQFAKKIPEVIIYVFAEWQEKLDDLQTEKLVDYFIQGNEQIEEQLNKFTKNKKSSLIIFDDQINSQTTTSYAARLFTVDARHSGKSCIWITQNLFGMGKNGADVRSIRTNADYLILFKCPGDCLSIQTISKQMTGGPLLYNIHSAITSQDPYSYLMINITQSSNEKLKFTSHTFEKDGVMRVYVPQVK